MPNHVEMKSLKAPVGDSEEAIEHTKGQRWHSEKVHRGNDLRHLENRSRLMILAADHGPSRTRAPDSQSKPAVAWSHRTQRC
jgi:hypothetical protein